MSDHSLARTNRARRVTVTAHSALPIWALASSNAPCKFGLERESHGRDYSPGAGIPHGMAMAGQRRWTATMHARQYSQNGTDRLEIADVDGDGFDAKNATPRPTLLTTCISQKLSSTLKKSCDAPLHYSTMCIELPACQAYIPKNYRSTVVVLQNTHAHSV
jgi:hypothetical protein